MPDDHSFSFSLALEENYRFVIDFDEYGNYVTDEPEPLGAGDGPNPVRLMAAGVANCLAASLLFAIRKFREEPGDIRAEVNVELHRVDKRLRVKDVDVILHLGNRAENIPHLERALSQFEDFCVVTQSVRDGFPVNVSVLDGEGVALEHG